MLIQIEWHPSRRQLHGFGVSTWLASAGLAIVLRWVWHAAPGWSWAVLAAGTATFLCSLISRKATRVLYLGLSIPALPVGFVVSFLLLAGFYFLVITPLALIFRLIGRDALCRGFDATAESYWVPRRPSAETELPESTQPKRPSLVREFWYFLKYNKKWWLLPILIMLLLLCLLVLVGGYAPVFIYPLF